MNSFQTLLNDPLSGGGSFGPGPSSEIAAAGAARGAGEAGYPGKSEFQYLFAQATLNAHRLSRILPSVLSGSCGSSGVRLLPSERSVKDREITL